MCGQRSMQLMVYVAQNQRPEMAMAGQLNAVVANARTAHIVCDGWRWPAIGNARI